MAENDIPGYCQVSWAAQTGLPFGDLDEWSIAFHHNTSGRLDIYRVPVCESHPNGIWYKLNTGSYYDVAEPGCCDWEKTLLLQIRLSGNSDIHDKVEEASAISDEPRMTNHTVEYIHPDIVVDLSKLNIEIPSTAN